MSLILDALKRSEAERKAASGESSMSLPSRPRGARRTGYWLAALALALVAAAAWQFDWLGATGDRTPGRVPKTTAAPAPAEASPPAAAVPADDEERDMVAERSEPETVVSNPPEPPVVVEPGSPGEAGPREPETTSEPAEDYLPIETLQDDAAREWIRDMTVNMHVFAPEPENRFVLINLQRREQGDTLEAGIRLVEITAEGMVLGINGQQYLWRSR